MNPFVTTGYAGAEYFCDREKESADLISFLENRNNVVLSADRRIGKTDLIKHCENILSKKDEYNVFLIDIYSTRNLTDFTIRFADTILKALMPKGEKVYRAFLSAISSLHPTISFDEMGKMVLSYGIDHIKSPLPTLESIFSYIEHSEKYNIIAIDEFQQISFYPEKNVEATLRTYIQNCRNASFIYSGSKRHLIAEMFVQPARPFYQSSVPMSLKPIPIEKYSEFCRKNFRSSGKDISEEAVMRAYDIFGGVTMYIQRVMNTLFSNAAEDSIVTPQEVEETISYLIDLAGNIYETMLYQLPDKQKEVLCAIAIEGKVKKPTSKDFTKKYSLASASSIQSAMKGLSEKGLIVNDNDGWRTDDILFQLWIRKNRPF